MKLLICTRCQDVFKLNYHLKSCDCGHTKGRYESDGSTAVVNGNGISLALGNGDVARAIYSLPTMGDVERNAYYAEEAPTRIRYAWVRPHTGLGNPHTRIDAQLGVQL